MRRQPHQLGCRWTPSLTSIACLTFSNLHLVVMVLDQVRAGAVAERVATEGVMLQYAVDTQLDLCLSTIYESVTKPPMPINPYPRLLNILRAHAARLDLFQVRRMRRIHATHYQGLVLLWIFTCLRHLHTCAHACMLSPSLQLFPTCKMTRRRTCLMSVISC